MSNAALTWAMSTKVGSSTRKLVLLVLADRANDDNWSTWVGQETIAAETELSVRSVGRALAELERDGVIERSQRRRGDGFRSSDLIRLNMQWEPADPPPDAELSTVSPDRESPDTVSPDSVSGCSDQEHLSESHLTESHQTGRHLTLCPTSPDTVSNLTRHSVGAENEPSGEPSIEPSENTSLATTNANDDIHRLAALLAQHVATHNDHPPPDITKRWLRDMRLLIDRGPLGQSSPEPLGPERVENAIHDLFTRFNQPNNGGFCWADQVRSPGALRKHWLKIRQHARQQTTKHHNDSDQLANVIANRAARRTS